ncbi:ABC transporter ATP-binding protein [Williamsia sp. 1135]|uniref:ABC transporter transmembrane domain-containing protein n=1 Tax=Williamsia sp. 1135 TaxID=1889262 RepID=UPI001F0A9057|nr:ABC transporter ATP-binding protein [Williamsia sp. 1135]
MTDAIPVTTMPIAGARRVLAVIGQHLSGRTLMLISVIGALVAAAALSLVTPWGLGRMVDVATGDVSGGSGTVWAIGGVMFGAAVGLAIFTGLGLALVGQLMEKVLARIRERMITAGLTMPLGRVEAAGTGDLVSRATDDVSQVSIAIGRAVPALSTSVFAAILTVAGLGVLDWRFLGVVAVTVPVYIVGVRMYLASAPEIYAAERAATADRAHQLLGAIRGLETVYAFGLTRQMSLKIASHSWAVVRWSMRAVIVQNRLFGRLNFAEFPGDGNDSDRRGVARRRRVAQCRCHHHGNAALPAAVRADQGVDVRRRRPAVGHRVDGPHRRRHRRGRDVWHRCRKTCRCAGVDAGEGRADRSTCGEGRVRLPRRSAGPAGGVAACRARSTSQSWVVQGREKRRWHR